MRKLSEKHKEKIKRALSGRKRPDLAGSNNGMYEKHHTIETRRKISETRRARKISGMPGSSNPMWRGGVSFKDGYRMIKNRDHPYTNARGYVYEHRLVMEKKLGRYLR